MELGKLSHALMILGVDRSARIPTKWKYAVSIEKDSIATASTQEVSNWVK